MSKPTVEAMQRELLVCQTEEGREPFIEWFQGVDPVSASRIQVKLSRLEDGNFSDVKPLGQGVSELKMDFGPGYRVYFGQKNKEVHLILGGTKATQAADIDFAKSFWRDHA